MIVPFLSLLNSTISVETLIRSSLLPPWNVLVIRIPKVKPHQTRLGIIEKNEDMAIVDYKMTIIFLFIRILGLVITVLRLNIHIIGANQFISTFLIWITKTRQRGIEEQKGNIRLGFNAQFISI